MNNRRWTVALVALMSIGSANATDVPGQIIFNDGTRKDVIFFFLFDLNNNSFRSYYSVTSRVPYRLANLHYTTPPKWRILRPKDAKEISFAISGKLYRYVSKKYPNGNRYVFLR